MLEKLPLCSLHKCVCVWWGADWGLKALKDTVLFSEIGLKWQITRSSQVSNFLVRPLVRTNLSQNVCNSLYPFSLFVFTSYSSFHLFLNLHEYACSLRKKYECAFGVVVAVVINWKLIPNTYESLSTWCLDLGIRQQGSWGNVSMRNGWEWCNLSRGQQAEHGKQWKARQSGDRWRKGEERCQSVTVSKYWTWEMVEDMFFFLFPLHPPWPHSFHSRAPKLRLVLWRLEFNYVMGL